MKDKLKAITTHPVTKAGINLIPYVGGTIASLIEDYVPTAKEGAKRKALEHLVEKVADIDSRIVKDAINKDDFADLYFKFEALAAKTNREDKLRTAANIFANSLLPPTEPNRSPYEELEHLMHCADALTSGAIAVLGASIKVKPPRHASQGDTPFGFKELHHMLPNMDPQVVMGSIAELRGLHLLNVTEGLIQSPEFEAYQFRVTPLGSRFADRFIEGRM